MSTEPGYDTIEVSRLSPALGALVSGVDISAGLTDGQFDEIRRAFVEHGVIFLRDQDITPSQHVAFAERWGAMNVNRFFTAADAHPMVAEVRKERDQALNIGASWHTDHSYDTAPAMGSILYARAVPHVGGDTLFASMYAAHDALSDGLRRVLGGLSAHHTSRHAFGAAAYADLDPDDVGGRISNPEAANQDALHPVIICHPLSGRSALYVNGDFTTRFEGWTIEESRPLLRYLYAHAVQNEFTCRFKWEQGSMAIWDNRATQHSALNDYQGEFRLMHRVTIEGEPLDAATAEITDST